MMQAPLTLAHLQMRQWGAAIPSICLHFLRRALRLLTTAMLWIACQGLSSE